MSIANFSIQSAPLFFKKRISDKPHHVYSRLAPLAMSQTKDDLVKHLNIGAETYTLMAKETDTIYRWLISEKGHLKTNCKGRPPYDWSDIDEKSKDEAMKLIVQNGSDKTAYYWNLARPTSECPNWIARWFLYHKFRYRDGRNRNIKAEIRDNVSFNSAAPSNHHRNHRNHHPSQHSYHSYRRQVHGAEDHSLYYPDTTMDAGDGRGYNYSPTEHNSSTGEFAAYSSSQTYSPSSSLYATYSPSSSSSYATYLPITRSNGQAKPYDPVRDL